MPGFVRLLLNSLCLWPLSALGFGVFVSPRRFQSSFCTVWRICWYCLSSRLQADWTRPVPSPRALIGSWGHMRDPEGWNSDLWLLALLFLFKNRWVCGSLLGLGAFGRGWRQLRTATGSWGGSGNSPEMFSQVPRTPAAGCYYLNPMTPESQEMYLRFDQTARRSPYRMSRILARHHLVTKIQQGELPALPGCRSFLSALSCAT